MYNSTNPAELYAGTTWEELPADKFLKTGATPLQQAGSNSVKIAKDNLPAEKLQVESFSISINKPTYTLRGSLGGGEIKNSYGLLSDGRNRIEQTLNNSTNVSRTLDINASTSGTASPYTSAMGSGTALTINPAHITVKAWKRLT